MTTRFSIIVTCEHGGNRIPRPYDRLFRGDAGLLGSHRGYDPGALDMARYLSRELDAPLEFSDVSRLLVDLNRSVGHRNLHATPVRSLDAPTKERILRRFYHPHRDRVERRIAKHVARGRMVVHVASHSFTPELDGVVRDADVACLYDPERAREKRFCDRWLEELSSLAPDLRLRRNYPYRGRDDGLTRHLRRRFPATGYLGVELELNQALWFGDRRKWLEIRRSVVTALASATQSGSNR